ncbi:hypothetical protein ACKVMT_01320 [Halobacteriales archaeon Cl-PHB]
MPSESDQSTPTRRLRSAVSRLASCNSLGMPVAGLVAGYSTVALYSDTVAITIVGPVPSPATGLVGLAVAFLALNWASVCVDCGGRSCSCGSDAGDRCAYDPE